MINLTSFKELIISLISKAIGKQTFSFWTYSYEKIILEFKTDDYRFVLSKEGNSLRVYDNGNIYFIQNTILIDSSHIEQAIRDEAVNLKNYYDCDAYIYSASGSAMFNFVKRDS